MERARNPVRSLAAILAALCAPACATLLDFQDPVDPPADAATAFGGDASVELEDVTLAIPAGWRGPLRLEETTGTPSDCGDDFPVLDYDGHTGLQGKAPDCTCTCGAPSGVTCGAPAAKHFTDGACGTVCAAGATVQGCARPTCAGGIGSIRVSAAATGGSCTGNASTQIAPPTWSTQVRLCGGSTCGSKCTGNVCIATLGAASCPGSFPSLHTAHGALTDTRACSACTCGTPTGATCGGSIATYATGSCGAATSTASFDACVPYDAKDRITAASAPLATGGGCAPSGGAATGSVTAADPTTICCRF